MDWNAKEQPELLLYSASALWGFRDVNRFTLGLLCPNRGKAIAQALEHGAKRYEHLLYDLRHSCRIDALCWKLCIVHFIESSLCPERSPDAERDSHVLSAIAVLTQFLHETILRSVAHENT